MGMDDAYELARFDWGKESFDVFAPVDSGVYFIFNWGEKLIYVGEAVNINRRLTEHLNQQRTSQRLHPQQRPWRVRVN